MNLTVDVGTTNTKVSIWASVETTTPVEQRKFPTPKKVHGENVDFDPEGLFKEIVRNIQAFQSANLVKVTKISIASVAESGVLIDEKGNRASEMIAWYDNRAQPIIDSLTNDERALVYQISGIPPHAHYSAGKIRWLLENGLDESQHYTWLCIPDYLVYRFSGVMRTEYSIASRTMVLDLHKREWSNTIKKIFGIQKVNFPRLLAGGETAGVIKPEIARETKLSDSVTLTIAGHDHMAGSFSSQQKESELLDSTGTTEGILLLSDTLEIDSVDLNDCIAFGIYQNPSLYTEFTALPAAGLTVEWFMKMSHITEAEFMKKGREIYNNYLSGDIDPSHLTFVIPHLNGSGTPVKANDTKGLWYGMTYQTSLDDMILGLFVGLTFELKHAMESFHNSKVKLIKLIGPATEDPLWIQLRADLLGVPVMAMETPEAVSRGANILADAVDNRYIQKGVTPGEMYAPRGQNDLVAELKRLYEKVYKPLYTSKVQAERH